MNSKKIIDSFMVQDYKPPAVIRSAFQEFEALKAYQVGVCGKEAPSFVRLPKALYAKLAEVVTTKSDKRRTLKEVRYNGLLIISEHEAAP